MDKTGQPASAYIGVKWKSRTAGFTRTSVQTIIEKACMHFRLGPIMEDLVLRGSLEGVEYEVTDDILQYLPREAVITLSRIPHECDSEDETVYEGQSCSLNKSTGAVGRPLSSRGTWWSRMGQGESYPISIKKPGRNDKSITVWVYSTDTVSELKQKIFQSGGDPPDEQGLVFAERWLENNQTLSEYNIKRGSTLHSVGLLLGKKPVIYLFPPHPMSDVTVSVGLVPQWNFTHIYPPTETKTVDDGAQQISWTVSAKPDGTLIERVTGLELAYLFWEAATNPTHAAAPPSPPTSPPLSPRLDQSETNSPPLSVEEHFDPAKPSLAPDSPTAVVLTTHGQLLPYLDRALAGLGLHTTARNDFITYWLPALAKHPYVALRFLRQSAYARAAALDVDPRPDVVTRVFMLFRGVPAEDVGLWATASERVEAVDWTEVVGVQPRDWDASVFRVLEWGAMEVL